MKTKLTEAEAIVLWMQLPEKERATLPAKQMEQLERWNVADNLMREHMVERVVIKLLVEKFSYSESTARRDLDCARRVWGTRPRSDKNYLSQLLVDFLMESMVKAAHDRKFGDVARLAGKIMEAAGINMPDEELPDPDANNTFMTLQPVFDPLLVGTAPLSEDERRLLAEDILRKKKETGVLPAAAITKLAKDD